MYFDLEEICLAELDRRNRMEPRIERVESCASLASWHVRITQEVSTLRNPIWPQEDHWLRIPGVTPNCRPCQSKMPLARGPLVTDLWRASPARSVVSIIQKITLSVKFHRLVGQQYPIIPVIVPTFCYLLLQVFEQQYPYKPSSKCIWRPNTAYPVS